MVFRKPVVVFELLSCVLLFCVPMDCIAHQALLSLGFPGQEYWSRLPFPSPRGLFHPGVKPISPVSAGRFLTSEPPGKSDGGSDPHPPASGQQEVHLPLSSHGGGLVPSGPPVTCRDPDLEEGGHPRLASGAQPADGDRVDTSCLPCSCCGMLASPDPAAVVTLTPGPLGAKRPGPGWAEFAHWLVQGRLWAGVNCDLGRGDGNREWTFRGAERA